MALSKSVGAPNVPAGVDLDKALHLLQRAQRAEEALAIRSVYPEPRPRQIDPNLVASFMETFLRSGYDYDCTRPAFGLCVEGRSESERLPGEPRYHIVSGAHFAIALSQIMSRASGRQQQG